MRRNGYLFTVTAVGVFVLAGAINSPAQAVPQAEPSYDVTLQLVVGSNDGGKTDLPSDLAGAAKQMRSHFGFSNYKLASTFLGRITNGGSFEYKSAHNILGQPSTTDAQTFLEWSLGDFRTVPMVGGGQGAMGRAFRFGTKVPVIMAGGKDGSQVQYESLGVNVGRFVVAQNSPTLIGTLNLPGTSGTVFLVMTVRSAD